MQVRAAYGVPPALGGMMDGRTTFVIDPLGIVRLGFFNLGFGVLGLGLKGLGIE